MKICTTIVFISLFIGVIAVLELVSCTTSACHIKQEFTLAIYYGAILISIGTMFLAPFFEKRNSRKPK